MKWSRWLPYPLLAVLVSVSVVWSSDASAASCGVERWSVKTGTDPDAGLVGWSLIGRSAESVLWREWARATPSADLRDAVADAIGENLRSRRETGMLSLLRSRAVA